MRYRPEIDGLRAISVVSVVVFHAELFWKGTRLLPGGYLGVDVFFIISGYLITNNLLATLRTDKFSFKSFYIRRVRRILPALYAVLFISLIAAVSVLPPDSLIEFSKTGLAALFFVANIYLGITQDYFSEAAGLSSLLHLWSLSVEEQFYLFYPLLLGLVYRFKPAQLAKAVISLAVVSLLLGAVFQNSRPEKVFYLVHFRAWELLAGSAVAILLRSEASEHKPVRQPPPLLTLFGCLAILVAFFFGQPSGLSGYSFTVLAVLGACWVVAFGGRGDPASRVLSSKPFVGVGLISYSLYLWHQPVFAFARHYSIGEISISQRVLLMIGAATLAAGTWAFVEKPFRKPGMASDRSILIICGSLTAVLTVAFATILATGGLPQRYTPEQREMLAVSAERGTLTLKAQNCESASLERVCVIGRMGKTPTWAVLGDSHAETLSDALSQLFDSIGVSAEILTYPGCPYVLGVDPVNTTEQCAYFAQAALDKMKRDGIRTVVVNDRLNAYLEGSRFDNHEGGIEPGAPIPVKVVGSRPANENDRMTGVQGAFFKTIQTLLENNFIVIYIAPVPEVGWNVPHTVVKLMTTGSLPLTTSREIYLDRNRRVYDVLQSFDGSQHFIAVYPDAVFCSKESGRCSTHTATRLLYTDTDHLSREGANLLVDYLAEKLKEVGIVTNAN